MDGRRRVLVVEDDTAIRSLIRFLVQREDWIADEVSDGSEALSKIRNERYDAIVLDLMLPSLPGDTILTEIRRTTPGDLGRIIIITASHAYVRKIDTTGVGAVVTKPFDIDQLMNVLRNCMVVTPDASE
jgi:DNA-binding response OmpR family regulator